MERDPRGGGQVRAAAGAHGCPGGCPRRGARDRVRGHRHGGALPVPRGAGARSSCATRFSQRKISFDLQPPLLPARPVFQPKAKQWDLARNRSPVKSTFETVAVRIRTNGSTRCGRVFCELTLSLSLGAATLALTPSRSPSAAARAGLRDRGGLRPLREGAPRLSGLGRRPAVRSFHTGISPALAPRETRRRPPFSPSAPLPNPCSAVVLRSSFISLAARD